MARQQRYFNFGLLFMLLILQPTFSSSSFTSNEVTAPNVTVAGDPFLIWAAVNTLHKCGFIDVPDIPPRLFLTNITANSTSDGDKKINSNINNTHPSTLLPGAGHPSFTGGGAALLRMIVGSTNYHIMEGTSLDTLNRSCAYAWNETGDPSPSDFAANEFLDSSFAFENATVYTLVHTEFPGNDYGNCSGPSYPHCWTVTIGLAVSYDYGSTFQHALPPPHHLVAAVPYGYNESQLAYGWGDPSNILFNPNDGFYYAAIWNRNQVGLQNPGVCMMRTNDLSTPSSWRAWGGSEYNISFVSPYTMPPGTESEHICTVTNLPSCPLGSMVWSTYLNMYVASMDCSLQAGSQFYIATSSDLITWSQLQPIYGRKDLPANVSAQVTSMSYPVFLDMSTSGDRNYNTIGANPYLLWVSIGHSPYTDGRRVFATPMQFN